MSERTEAGRRAGPPPVSRDLRGLLSPSPEAEPFDSAELSTFFFTCLVMTVYVVEHIAERLSTKLVTHENVKASTRTRCPMAGIGIALISAHTIAAEAADGRLVCLDVDGLPVIRRWYVVNRSDRALSAAARAFRDFAVSQGSTFLPSAVGPRPELWE
jgi:DNA-binding transcriptional LysR family regulator